MNKLMVFLIAVLFFFSGLTSLVYETLWIRVLSLGVGSTSASMGLVLSIFFFGLSMGSFIAGKFSYRIRRPLLTYGILEGLIGFYSLGIIYILFDFHKILGFLPLEGSFSWFGVAMKFFLVFIFLSIPTIFMGASLPLLVKIFVKNGENLGKKLGLLYGLNTMGAVFGAFLTGFYFIPTFGILKSNHMMAILNFTILIVAYILQKKLAPMEVQPKRKRKSFFTLLPKNSSTAKKLILVSCGIIGFTSITAEVVWNKYLGIFLGSNIFGLGLILSLFLLGIALGSLILSFFVEKVKDKINLFITLAILGVGLTLTATYLLNGAPILVHLISYYLGATVSVLAIKSVITGIILFIPTSFFGALLPLGTRILVDDHHDTPEIVGTAYTINTIGAILGSCLSGLVFIPIFGSSFTLKFGLVLLVLIILFITAKKYKSPLPLSISLLALFVIFFAQGIDFKNIIKSAYYQRATSDSTLEDVMKYFAEKDGEVFKLIIEGKTGIISLSQVPYEEDDWQSYLRLKTNGLNESFYNLEKIDELPKYEGLLAFLPYALAEDPKSAFIVGYGGGYSADFLTSTDLELVHVVELEEGIMEAADFVHKGNNPILKRKNLKLEIEDARFVLATGKTGPYDIIISQPSHSWLTGVANLFTQEYFEIVKGNLTEKGVFSQWLNLYNMNQEVLKSILKTFYTVFPHGGIFTNLGDEEVILIGTKKDIKYSLERLTVLSQNKKIKDQMAQIPFKSPYHLLAHFSIGREDILKLTHKATLNTDVNAYAEVRQSRLFYQGSKSNPEDWINNNFSSKFSEILTLKKEQMPLFYRNMLEAVLGDIPNYNKFHLMLAKFKKFAGDNPDFDKDLGKFNLRIERFVTAAKYLEKSLKYKRDPETLNLLLETYLALQKYDKAARIYSKNIKIKNAYTECLVLEASAKNRDWKRSAKLAARITKNYDNYFNDCGDYINKALGTYYYQVSDFEDAISYFESFLEIENNDLASMGMLISSYIGIGRIADSADYMETFRSLLQTEADALYNSAEFLKNVGLTEDAKTLEDRAQNYSPF
ncbi:MAG: hypothetical protein E2O68_00425 [Deltaproteobacteria bacterium]|nr:MAG: hypothetical protein E2O68_00425 [Deltaproteobacteria bacterium]